MANLRDPGLYNDDLAPIALDKRTWGLLQLCVPMGGDERGASLPICSRPV